MKVERERERERERGNSCNIYVKMIIIIKRMANVNNNLAIVFLCSSSWPPLLPCCILLPR